ncbi:unnamed protein product [Rotaria socialis]
MVENRRRQAFQKKKEKELCRIQINAIRRILSFGILNSFTDSFPGCMENFYFYNQQKKKKTAAKDLLTITDEIGTSWLTVILTLLLNYLQIDIYEHLCYCEHNKMAVTQYIIQPFITSMDS